MKSLCFAVLRSFRCGLLLLLFLFLFILSRSPVVALSYDINSNESKMFAICTFDMFAVVANTLFLLLFAFIAILHILICERANRLHNNNNNQNEIHMCVWIHTRVCMCWFLYKKNLAQQRLVSLSDFCIHISYIAMAVSNAMAAVVTTTQYIQMSRGIWGVNGRDLANKIDNSE